MAACDQCSFLTVSSIDLAIVSFLLPVIICSSRIIILIIIITSGALE